jgi:hypothetical protein
MIVGHNVPRHAALLLEYNKRPDIKPINLKSIAVTINFDSLIKTHTHTRSCIDMGYWLFFFSYHEYYCSSGIHF